METRVKPELELKRKTCESCGETQFEVTSGVQRKEKYVCGECRT